MIRNNPLLMLEDINIFSKVKSIETNSKTQKQINAEETDADAGSLWQTYWWIDYCLWALLLGAAHIYPTLSSNRE